MNKKHYIRLARSLADALNQMELEGEPLTDRQRHILIHGVITACREDNPDFEAGIFEKYVLEGLQK